MKKILFLIILPVLFAQFSAFAQAAPPANINCPPTELDCQQGLEGGGAVASVFGDTDPRDPRFIIADIIYVVLGLLGTIFIVILIYAGIKYMTSLGNEEQISSAKGQIVSAVIGLAIILSAYGITFFVTKAILNATGSY